MSKNACEVALAADDHAEQASTASELRTAREFRPKFRSQLRRCRELPDEPWPFGAMSNDMIAELMHVDIRTVRRWRRAQSVPKPLRLLAHILIRGDLSLIAPAWDGWKLRDGQLHSPYYSRPFTVAEMEHYSVLTSRALALEIRVQRLEAENKALRAGVECSAEQRTEQHAKLRAMGGAEMLAALAQKFGAMLADSGSKELMREQSDALSIERSAWQLLGSLYHHTDPATGAPFYMNNPGDMVKPRRPALHLAVSRPSPDGGGQDEPPPAA